MTKYHPTPHVEQVSWLDHSGHYNSDHFSVADIARRVKYDVVNRTCGMLVYEDARKIVLASEARVDEDLDEVLFGVYTSIYKVCITERFILKEAPTP